VARRVGLTVLMVWAMLALAASLAAGVLAAPSTKTKTVRLSGHVFQDNTPYTVDGSAHCAAKWILVIDLPSHVISYQASVNQPGVGPFDFSGPPFTNPITGFGDPYKVPKGHAGWFLGGDSGPGTCTESPPGKYDDIKATGIVPGTSRGSKHRGSTHRGGTGRSDCVVPGLLGRVFAAAKREITKADCAVGHVRRRVSARADGIVLAQSPKPGTHLPGGSRVNMTLSKG
jgi:PASTA domain